MILSVTLKNRLSGMRQVLLERRWPTENQRQPCFDGSHSGKNSTQYVVVPAWVMEYKTLSLPSLNPAHFQMTPVLVFSG